MTNRVLIKASVKGDDINLRLISPSEKVHRSFCIDYDAFEDLEYRGTALVTGSLTNKGSARYGYADNKVGGLAGWNGAGGTIKDCQVQVNALTNTGSYARVGGVAGQNNGTIGNVLTEIINLDPGINTHLTNSGEGAYVGGLAGFNDTNDTIENCRVRVDGPLTNTGKEAYVGGVAGQNNGTIQGTQEGMCSVTVTTLTNTLTNNTRSVYVGGVAGRNEGAIRTVTTTINTLTNNTGSVYVGGVAGENSKDATVTDCMVTVIDSLTNSGQKAYVGGVAGSNAVQNAAVKDCTATVEELYNRAEMSADDKFYSYEPYIGGVVGVSRGGTIKNCTAEVTELRNAGMQARVGGLVGLGLRDAGLNLYNAIESCTVKVGSLFNNTGGSSAYVGGVVGYNEEAGEGCKATNCKAFVGSYENKNTDSGTLVGCLSGSSSGVTDCECNRRPFFGNTSTDMGNTYDSTLTIP